MEVIIILCLSIIIKHIIKTRQREDALSEHECKAELKQAENELEKDVVWTKPLLTRIDEKERGSQIVMSSTTSSDRYSLRSSNSDSSKYTNINEDEESGTMAGTEDVEVQPFKTENIIHKCNNTIQKRLEEYISYANKIEKKLEEYIEDADEDEADTEDLFTSLTPTPDLSIHPSHDTKKDEEYDDDDENILDDSINERKYQTNCYGQLFKFNISQIPVVYIGRHLLSKFRKYNIV